MLPIRNHGSYAGERELGNARRGDVVLRVACGNAVDAVGRDVDGRDPVAEQPVEAGDGLALAAAGVENPRRLQRPDQLAEVIEEAADHPLDDRVAGLELDFVGGSVVGGAGHHRMVASMAPEPWL